MNIGNYIFYTGAWDGVKMEDDGNRKLVSIIGYYKSSLADTFIFFGLRITKIKEIDV